MTPTVRPLTVAYVGNFGPRHSTENHVALSLIANGHTVVPYQEDALHRGELTDDRLGWPQLAESIAERECDLMLWTRTWQHERPAEQEQALTDLRDLGIATASYHLDLYLGLDREEQIGREAFWRTDLVCTADGNLPDAEWADQFGVTHRWIRAGVLAAECVPGQPRRDYLSDVAFVGSHARYHAEWPYRQQLVAELGARYGRGFKRWPRGGRAIRNEDLNDLYASAKVIVGDSLCVGFDRARYWSDRVYETVGRGGFLIHPFIEGMQDEFTDGEHLRFYTFGDFAELAALIDYYLAHDDERRAIAAAGQAHVRATATYTHRTAELIGHVMTLRPDLATGRASRLLPCRINGQRPRVILREGSTDAEVFRDVFDEHTYKAAEPFLADGVVLDVGANVGAFTLWALSKGARHVIAYEPEPDNFAALGANCVALGSADLKQLAVGDTHGTLYLAPGPGGRHGGGTHVYSAGEPETDDPVEVTVVPVNEVLADAIAAHGELAVMKVDIEGAEYVLFEALDGALLASVRCLVMEFHGPGMPHLPHLRGAADFGPMVAKLAEHGHVTVMGRPSVGGVITWRRY